MNRSKGSFMKPNLFICAIIETLAFAVIAFFAFTTFNSEYLFGWIADNWVFYLGLIGVSLLLLPFNKKFVSGFMAAGIVIGVFVGNYVGKLFMVFNESKIVESMSAEDIYKLHHHPGFEIWIGTILLLILIGIIVQITSQHRTAVVRRDESYKNKASKL